MAATACGVVDSMMTIIIIYHHSLDSLSKNSFFQASSSLASSSLCV